MFAGGAMNTYIYVDGFNLYYGAVKGTPYKLNLPVGMLNPHGGSPSHELRKFATFVKPIRKGVLAAPQFSTSLRDATGAFHKPVQW